MVFDADGKDASLPVVHNFISNFKAMVTGTHHGVRKKYLQSYMGVYTYRYNNRRNSDVFNTLLEDVNLSPKRNKTCLVSLFSAQDVTSDKKAV